MHCNVVAAVILKRGGNGDDTRGAQFQENYTLPEEVKKKQSTRPQCPPEVFILKKTKGAAVGMTKTKKKKKKKKRVQLPSQLRQSKKKKKKKK